MVLPVADQRAKTPMLDKPRMNALRAFRKEKCREQNERCCRKERQEQADESKEQTKDAANEIDVTHHLELNTRFTLKVRNQGMTASKLKSSRRAELLQQFRQPVHDVQRKLTIVCPFDVHAELHVELLIAIEKSGNLS